MSTTNYQNPFPDVDRRAWDLLSDSEIDLMISLFPSPVILPRGVSHSVVRRFAMARKRIGFLVRERRVA